MTLCENATGALYIVNKISYSGGQLDEPMTFLAPVLVLYSFVMFMYKYFWKNKDACLLEM